MEKLQKEVNPSNQFSTIYRQRSTALFYTLLNDNVIDTSEAEPKIKVLYKNAANQLFVMEHNEFYEKFFKIYI